MKLAIITDSTCDFTQAQLDELNVKRVPLYVHFKGKTYLDWLELSPKDIIEGVKAGADMPSTSQPSPQDFADAYAEAAKAGAEEILCITISSTLSGTYQSATIAAQDADVPVTVVDTEAASVGVGMMVKRAAKMRDEVGSVDEIVAALEQMKQEMMLRFTVGSLEYLQKNGRIGGAQALLGGLLKIKPILSLVEGRVEAIGRARGSKRALKTIVDDSLEFADHHQGKPVIYFLHVQDPEAAKTLREELADSGLEFIDAGIFEIGTVVASHVGPGTYGVYMHSEMQP